MKIESVITNVVFSSTPESGFVGGKNWILVKIETDEGISGWGESYCVPDRDLSIEQMIKEIGVYLEGKDPFHIKHFTQMVYNDFAARRGSLELYCAVSGIEQAMWDIVGKSLKVPVYNLLGGPLREKIRVYANGWSSTARSPEEMARMAVETVNKGFTALKFDPFPGRWRLYIPKEHERIAAENVRAVREAVGSEIDLLIEVHRRLAPMHAVRFARMIEKYDLFWFEEPVPAENIDALAEVRRNVSIPVVTGETLYTKAPFCEVFKKQAADIINPDVCNCGGILELKEIATLADPNYVAVSPHNYNSTTMALAATLHASATMPNFIITEYFINFAELGNTISKNPFKVEDGYIKIPTTPGLGLEIDEEALADYVPKHRHPKRTFPALKDEF
jgi:galactonate dehydratase